VLARHSTRDLQTRAVTRCCSVSVLTQQQQNNNTPPFFVRLVHQKSLFVNYTFQNPYRCHRSVITSEAISKIVIYLKDRTGRVENNHTRRSVVNGCSRAVPSYNACSLIVTIDSGSRKKVRGRGYSSPSRSYASGGKRAGTTEQDGAASCRTCCRRQFFNPLFLPCHNAPSEGCIFLRVMYQDAYLHHFPSTLRPSDTLGVADCVPECSSSRGPRSSEFLCGAAARTQACADGSRAEKVFNQKRTIGCGAVYITLGRTSLFWEDSQVPVKLHNNNI